MPLRLTDTPYHRVKALLPASLLALGRPARVLVFSADSGESSTQLGGALHWSGNAPASCRRITLDRWIDNASLTRLLPKSARQAMEKLAADHGPMTPIFQGTAADCPEIPFPVGADLLQVLWCGGLHRYSEFGLRTYWRQSAECDRAFASHRRPSHLEHFGNVARLSLVAELIDFPMFHQLPGNVVRDLEQAQPLIDVLRREYTVQSGLRHAEDNLSGIYNDTLGAVPGVKIAGWPRWVQDEAPTCAKGHHMDLMLTLEAECCSRGADYWTARVASAGLSGMMFVGLFCCSTCPERPLREASSST